MVSMQRSANTMIHTYIKRLALLSLAVWGFQTAAAQTTGFDSLKSALSMVPSDENSIRTTAPLTVNARELNAETLRSVARPNLESNSPDRGHAFRLLGIASLMEDDYITALQHADSSLANFESAGDPVGSATADNLTGVIYYQSGAYELALNKFNAALSELSRSANKILFAQVATNAANAQLQLGNLKKASQLLDKSLNTFRNTGYKAGVAYVASCKGYVIEQSGDYQAAIDEYQNALNVYESINHSLGMGLSNANIGTAFLLDEQYNQALRYFRNSMPYLKNTDNNRLRIYAYNNIGDVYRRVNNYDKASTNLNQALEMAREEDDAIQAMISYNLMSKLYKWFNAYKTALEYHEQYLSLRDSLNQVQKSQLIAVLEKREPGAGKTVVRRVTSTASGGVSSADGDSDESSWGFVPYVIIVGLLGGMYWLHLNRRKKFRRVNQLLQEKNAEISFQHKHLEDQKYEMRDIKKELEQKDRQIKDLEKDIGNYKEAHQYFIDVMSEELRTPVDQLEELLERTSDHGALFQPVDPEEFAKIASASTRSTYGILENLQYWALIQQDNITARPVEVYMDELVSETKDWFRRMAYAKDIKILSNVAPHSVANADRKMIATVLRNLVGNAVKYSPKESDIELNVERADDQISVRVIDEGIGIDSEQFKELFEFGESERRSGTADESGLGLGLYISKEFVERNGGTIEVESTEGEGTTITFTLPVAEEEVVPPAEPTEDGTASETGEEAEITGQQEDTSTEETPVAQAGPLESESTEESAPPDISEPGDADVSDEEESFEEADEQDDASAEEPGSQADTMTSEPVEEFMQPQESETEVTDETDDVAASEPDEAEDTAGDEKAETTTTPEEELSSFAAADTEKEKEEQSSEEAEDIISDTPADDLRQETAEAETVGESSDADIFEAELEDDASAEEDIAEDEEEDMAASEEKPDEAATPDEVEVEAEEKEEKTSDQSSNEKKTATRFHDPIGRNPFAYDQEELENTGQDPDEKRDEDQKDDEQKSEDDQMSFL